jgi:hypothetical protein
VFHLRSRTYCFWGVLAPSRGPACDERSCRVGPGNFTPSPSQNRTGYSRIIRLVPSREGRRLPLNEGLLPANQLAQISGDDLPPSLHDHYSRFHTTTRQSAPRRRIGTFGLAPDAARSVSGHPPSLSRRKGHPAVLTSPNPLSTLQKQFACARLSRSCLPGSSSRRFPRRSRPWLLTTAARGGLGSTT